MFGLSRAARRAMKPKEAAALAKKAGNNLKQANTAFSTTAATASQTVCVNTAITSITYTYGGGATSAPVP